MKRLYYLLSCAVGILSITACSESEVSEVIDNTPQKMSFTVGTSTSDQTRATVRTLESQNPAVDWEQTDKVFVWGLNNTTASVFSFEKYGNYHNYAEFTGTIEPASKYYLMYPNVSGTSIVFEGESGHITTTIPAVQKATLNSFDPSAAVCTGATKGDMDKKVEVQHACAFLKITTTQPCYSVKVTPATNKEYSMTGGVVIETNSSGSALKPPFPNGVTSVTLTADGTANCTSTFPAGTYLMAIIPSTGYPGIEIEVDYGLGEDNPHVINTATIQMNAANIYNLGTASVQPKQISLSVAASPSTEAEEPAAESEDPDTRAVVRNLESQNPAVDWEQNDKVYVWGLGNTTASVFSFEQYGNYHNYAEFTGTIEPASKYYLMYPTVSGTTMVFDGETGHITTTIPAVQKATLNSFDPAAAICTGATKGNMDKKVEVQHACAFLKITTTQPCYSVTVTPATNKNYSMTGGVVIETSSSGSALLPPFPNGVASVTLTADGTANCSSTFPVGTYLMAIIPSTGYPGIDITVDYGLDANNPHVTNTATIQMNAANIYNLGVAEVKTTGE